MKRGKRYLEALKLVDKTKEYPLLEATDLVKKPQPLSLMQVLKLLSD